MRKLIFLLTTVCCSVCSRAQTGLYQYLKEIYTLDRPTVCYDYKVQLFDQKSGTLLDSLSGRIYRKGIEYIDSSTAAWTAVSGNYYCKLDHPRKEATVYDIDLIQRKLNLKIDRNGSSLLVIPDSVIAKHGQVTLDSSNGLYRYRCTVPMMPGIALSATIDKKTRSLVNVVYETQETEGGDGSRYRRVCTIYKIRNEIPSSVFNLEPVFRISGGKVNMNTKYAGYNLKTLIN